MTIRCGVITRLFVYGILRQHFSAEHIQLFNEKLRFRQKSLDLITFGMIGESVSAQKLTPPGSSGL